MTGTDRAPSRGTWCSSIRTDAIEIRVNGAALPRARYDRLSEIDQTANFWSSLGGTS